MAGFLGADTEQLRHQGVRTAQGAQRLQSCFEDLTGQVEGVEWNGPDADGFRERWRSEAIQQMLRACDRMRELSKDLDRQAEEQDTASDGDGDGGVWGAIGGILGGIGGIVPPILACQPATSDAGAGTRPGQEFYGDEGYGDRGQAANGGRPLGSFHDDGQYTLWDGKEVENDAGYIDTYGKFSYSAGHNTTTDGFGNTTNTLGFRAGGEIGLKEHLNGPFGMGLDASGRVGAEAYAEAGYTTGPDGFSAGAKAGSGVYGDLSATAHGPFGASETATVHGFVGAEANADAYSHMTRNEDGQANGWTFGADANAFVGAKADADISVTSPGGWFSGSGSFGVEAGYGGGAGGGGTISTDTVGFRVNGELAAELGLDGDLSFAVHPNAIVNTFTPGDYDIDDAIGDAKGAWDTGTSAVSSAFSSVNPFD